MNMSKNIPLLKRPYRSCVGLMVFNKIGQVFCGQRLDNKAEAWQLPQGGIDEGETPIEAGFRELKEETSIVNVEFVSEYPEWLNYDIPLPLANALWEGKFRGQTQRWLLFSFTGIDNEININTSHPEFKNWEWINPTQLPLKAISFKQEIYSKINKAFIPIINNFNSNK
ncbi:RNA pyrophosphohydrolase [Alphaproteobacteria bacterium]|jgi:putative (di)nucleoside polyphosphate hydrolase|nr:RNA pyrophosphohydrolase [Alphaproteobacteria bacterium]|tara:strand:- start:20932 stop:21438 length:507 start_codon:yes stop_codon:yes gene_type:complete